MNKYKPTEGKWIKVNGLLKMICVCEYGVYGVNSNDEIFSEKVYQLLMK